MLTLRDALNATLSAEAVEASYLNAVAGLCTTENAYVSPRDGVAHSRMRFDTPNGDGADTQNRAEVIAHGGMLHTRPAGNGEWATLDMPRPALGPLAFLTLLYGADLDRPVPIESGTIEVAISAADALERGPESLRGTLDDILADRTAHGGGSFPDSSTAHVGIRHDPLHISEMTVTTRQGEMTETFAVEVHPVPRRIVDVPIRWC